VWIIIIIIIIIIAAIITTVITNISISFHVFLSFGSAPLETMVRTTTQASIFKL